MTEQTTIRRRRISVSREGFSFLFVLLFIVIGALVRQVNLLFVLAGLLIAPLLINWRYGFAIIRKLSVTREPTPLAHAGQPLLVQFRVFNHHRWLTCWSLNIHDSIRKTFDPQHQFQSRNTTEHDAHTKLPGVRPQKSLVNVQEIKPQDSGVAVCRYRLDQRGEYELGPIKLATRFPLGLTWAFGKVIQNRQITVAPRIGRFTPRWSALAYGNEGRGDGRSREHSPDATGDFYSIRAWRGGDSRRAIHWRSTAKTGNLEVRQFEHERNAGLVIVLDMWQPSDATLHNIAATELATSIVATAADHSLKHHHGDICIVVAGSERHSFRGRATRDFRGRVLRHLATALPGTTIDLGSAAKQATTHLPRGFRVVVVSTRAQDSISMQDVTNELPSRTVVQWIDASSTEIDKLFLPD